MLCVIFTWHVHVVEQFVQRKMLVFNMEGK